MSLVYTANFDVSVVFPIAVIPTSATYRVTGPNGVLLDWTDMDLANVTVLTGLVVKVPAALNALTPIVAPLVPTRESRLVEVMVMSAGATARLTQDFVISADQTLQVMVNSFQSYVQALGAASGIPQMDNWNAADDTTRVPAMIAAYRDLSRMNYEIYYDRDDIYYRGRASFGLPFIGTIGRLYDYSPEQFLALEPDFVSRLYDAQVVEADERLSSPDSRANMRDAGVTMSKVGESTEMYNSRQPFKFGVSKRALKILGPYVNYSPRLIRS